MQTQYQQVEFMTMLAIKECDDKDFYRKDTGIILMTGRNLTEIYNID